MSRRPHDVFISYRKDKAKHLARHIKASLERVGYRVFLDLEDGDSGQWREHLGWQIENALDFLLILTPRALERCSDPDDILRMEITHALKRHPDLNVINLFVDGFNPKGSKIPGDVADLFEFQGIEYSNEHSTSSLAKLRGMLKARPRRRRLAPWIGAVAIASLLVTAVVLGWPYAGGSTAGPISESDVFVPSGDVVSFAIGKIAERIATALHESRVTEVAVSKSDDPQIPTSSPRICIELAYALKLRGIAIKQAAPFKVCPALQEDTASRESGSLKAKLVVDLMGASGHHIAREFPMKEEVDFFEGDRRPDDPDGASTFSSLYAITAVVPADRELPTTKIALTNSFGKEPIVGGDKLVRAARENPYALGIVVGDTLREPTDENGNAFIKIARGETYAIRLVNDSDYDAAVRLSIDGISLFSFSESHNSDYLLIPARKQCVIPGWPRTKSKTDAFLVTEYAKSEAARLVSPPEATGTITATFAAAWPRGNPAPSDEKVFTVRHASEATARGKELDQEYEIVERHIGLMRAAISIRYSSGEQ